MEIGKIYPSNIINSIFTWFCLIIKPALHHDETYCWWKMDHILMRSHSHFASSFYAQIRIWNTFNLLCSVDLQNLKSHLQNLSKLFKLFYCFSVRLDETGQTLSKLRFIKKITLLWSKHYFFKRVNNFVDIEVLFFMLLEFSQL